MKNVIPPRDQPTNPDTQAKAFARLDAWLGDMLGEDADLSRRAQFLNPYSLSGVALALPAADRDLCGPHIYEWMDDLRYRADEYEEAKRPAASYEFHRVDLDPQVAARIHSNQDHIVFIEDKDTGLFAAYDARIVGGPFRRDELPSYEKALS